MFRGWKRCLNEDGPTYGQQRADGARGRAHRTGSSAHAAQRRARRVGRRTMVVPTSRRVRAEHGGRVGAGFSLESLDRTMGQPRHYLLVTWEALDRFRPPDRRCVALRRKPPEAHLPFVHKLQLVPAPADGRAKAGPSIFALVDIASPDVSQRHRKGPSRGISLWPGTQ